MRLDFPAAPVNMVPSMRPFLPGAVCLLCSLCVFPAEPPPAGQRLTIAVVQMASGPTLEANRDRIVAGVSQAAVRGARLAVFPEGALRGEGDADAAAVEQAVSAIRAAARRHNIHALFGGNTRSSALKRNVNWALAVGPDGRDLFRCEKLYDNHRAAMPGVFQIDGVPCSAMICADRWLRGVAELPIQQGARISFELSNNYACEWVEPFGWYWNVPRALANNVWVVLANSANEKPGVPNPSGPAGGCHGHSAVIAPDGRIVAAARDDAPGIVIAELDVHQATLAEARARAAHPVLRAFWQAGLDAQSGRKAGVQPVAPAKSATTDVTLAVAQITGDLTRMLSMVREARGKRADLVAFPARAVGEEALPEFQTAAREHGMTVVIGAEHRADGGPRNSAFVIGPEGSVLTRYDQLSASLPFQAGTDAAAMWFTVKGVPAVVTVGKDALWTELAELAAVAGARIHVHLDNDPATGTEASQRRLQVLANVASFHTFTAAANVAGSMIWDDLRGLDESRAVVRNLPAPDSGPVEVYSPFSANLVARAGEGPVLLTATRLIPGPNPYHPRRTTGFNPQMEAWYRLGARSVHPE